MQKKKFYITTPIYYPNDIPHIGHAYTSIVADVLARWKKIQDYDVFFLTGTDDHGKKIAQAAEKKGKTPKEFTDELIPKFKDAWKKLNIEYNQFIRTTDKNHENVIKKILQKVYDKGDIYLGEYEGLYCTGCEAYYTEKDLEDGCCPIHKTKVENLKEKSYFFKLSKYQDKLLKLYKEHPEIIMPESKRNEVISRVKEGLRDLSVSRTNFNWGIPLPFDKKHVCYVWFDALFNYYSATRENNKEKYWPTNIHLIGKDILWFHAVYWPAFLMSAGIDLPKMIFAHGWWTFNKEKISKSRGRVLNIDELISIAGVDSARYFLLRATPFGEDGDFSEQALIKRHNHELANKLGNLVSRTTTLAEKYKIKQPTNYSKNKALLKKLKIKEIQKNFDNYEFDKALSNIFSFVDICNEYIQDKKPWETKDQTVLYELIDSIKAIAILLWPFIPETSEKIAEQLNFKIKFKNLEKPIKLISIKKSDILFQKINEDIKNMEKTKQTERKNTNLISYEDFAKIDLRVAKIIAVEEIPGADKLYKLTVDLETEQRTILAGIKKYYTQQELLNRRCIIVYNLQPRKMRGIDSQGMLLAAENDDQSEVVLLQPERPINEGSRIR